MWTKAKCFHAKQLTVFHILLQQCRIPDFQRLAEFIKQNNETYDWQYEELKTKLLTNVATCKHKLTIEQALYRYSDLNESALGGYFNENDDPEILASLEFVSKELRKIGNDIFGQIWSKTDTINTKTSFKISFFFN